MKVSIVIPIYNEANTVETLLQGVWDQPLSSLTKELIIVESNSTDGTRNLVQAFVTSHTGVDNRIQLILQESPLGKGNAVRAGLRACTGDIILIQDGDLEYDVKDYPLLLQPIVENRADFVLGSRHLSAGSWKIRKFEKNRFKAAFLNFGGILFHEFFNLLYGQRLTDPTTMYKVFRRSCIEGIHLESNRFDFDFEILGKLIRAGFNPLEVPISYRSRSFEEGKKVRIIRDPLTWVRAIIKFRFSRLR